MTAYTGADVVYKFSTQDSFSACINGGFGTSKSSSFEAVINGYSEVTVYSDESSYNAIINGWKPQSSFNAVIDGEGITTGPVAKIEISQNEGMSFVDVSNYFTGDGTISKNAFNSVATAGLQLDINVDNYLSETLKSHDIIRILLGYANATNKRFYGLVMNINEEQNKYVVSAENYAGLCIRRTHTGVYRQDAGTGNCIEIVKTILTKNLPELSYEDSTLPPTTVNLGRYAVQNKNINEIFDYIADVLGRVWWVDDNKMLWMVDRTFTASSGLTFTYGTNILGELRVNRDVSQWANYVIIDGTTRLIGYTESFTGDGTTTEFSLARVPHQVKVTVDDEVKMGEFSGSFAESIADYLVDCVDRTITFSTAPANGANIVIDHLYLARVHEELQDSISVDTYGRIDKRLGGEGVESQTEARAIGQNYLSLYSNPLTIYSCRTQGDPGVQVGKTADIVHSGKGINGTYNILEYTETFGSASGWIVDLNMNEMPYGFPDMYKDLLLKVKRLEESDRLGDEYIVKYYMYGKKMVVAITGATLSSRPIMDSMVWGHPSGGNSDWGTFKWGDRRGSETLEAVWT